MACLLIAGGLYLTDRYQTRRDKKKQAQALLITSPSSSSNNNEKSNLLQTQQTTQTQYGTQQRRSIIDEKNDVLVQERMTGQGHPALRTRRSFDSAAETEVGEESDDEKEVEKRKEKKVLR